VLRVSRGGQTLGTLRPGQRIYPIEQRSTNEVDIRRSMLTGTDLYTILQGVSQENGKTVTIKALVNPAVGLIWAAGVVFLLGALITIWPDPREARQLARRYAAALAREA
jgi:cytochrome c biogenesis factor